MLKVKTLEIHEHQYGQHFGKLIETGLIDWLMKFSTGSRNILFVCMERGIGKTLPFIFSKKSTFFQDDVIDFISRAPPVHLLPLFWRLLPFSAT